MRKRFEQTVELRVVKRLDQKEVNSLVEDTVAVSCYYLGVYEFEINNWLEEYEGKELEKILEPKEYAFFSNFKFGFNFEENSELLQNIMDKLYQIISDRTFKELDEEESRQIEDLAFYISEMFRSYNLIQKVGEVLEVDSVSMISDFR